MHPPPTASIAATSEAGGDIDARMASVLEALAQARSVADLERLRRAAEAAGLAAYQWNIPGDTLAWSGASQAVRGLTEGHAPVSGKAYAALIDPAAEAGRFDAVMRPAVDTGPGVPFSVTYPLRRQPDGTARILTEDTGRWYAGPDGRPAEAFGVIRRVERGGAPQLATTPPDVDALSGAAARARLLDALAEAIAESARTGHPCAFMVARIVNLRTINDACGTAAADAAIAMTGRRLRQVARTSDTVGRLTGSSFGVVLRQCNRDLLRIVAERFLAATRNVVETGHVPVWPCTVFGSALAPDHAGNAMDMLAAAEDALAAARRSSAPVAVADPSPGCPSLRTLTARTAADIATALAENRFRLAFRPVVTAGDGAIVMHETSLDLLDGNGERGPAHHLMPIAEALGVVRQIDSHALTLALDAIAGTPGLALLVPVSAASAADPRWQARVATLIAGREELAPRLTLAAPAGVPAQALDGLAQPLREAGGRLALLGATTRTGPGDIVVADPALADPAGDDPAGRRALAAFAAAARAAGRFSMAGPVTTADHAEALRAAGVDALWGQLFGDFAPQPLAEPAFRLPPRPPAAVSPPAAPDETPLARARAALDLAREAYSRRG